MVKFYKEEIRNRLYEFLNENKDGYTEDELDFIKNFFWINFKSFATIDILMQLYDEIGVYEILKEAATSGKISNKFLRDSFYEMHLKKLQDFFPIDGNILDVASGYIPAFGNNIAKKQLQIGTGKITVCDPSLIIKESKYKNMILCKEEFTTNTDVTKYDLITGIMPCEATVPIIEAACKSQKDFYVAMCGCVHFPNDDLMVDYGVQYLVDEYQDYVIDFTERALKKYDNGKLHIERLDSKYGIDYPILINKKQK